MKHHVRTQGKSAFSFRFRLFDRYVDAGETFETEYAAAFSADVAKHFLREWYHIDLQRSSDPEGFAFETYRQNVDLSDRLSVEKFLSPGVKKFLLEHRDALDQFAEANRPEVTPWSALRKSPLFQTSDAVREWVINCEAAELEAAEFSVIDPRSFITRFEVARNALETALRSLRVAQRMHADVSNPRLVERVRLLNELLTHLEATEAHIRFLSTQFAEEQIRVTTKLKTLENSRPQLS